VLTRVLGAQVLRDVQTFVSALDTMFGGFRERAEYTYRLLRAPGTAFLVIAAPEPDALREASYFVERLAQEGMPLAGLILNKVHQSPAARLSAARSLAAAETLQADHGGRDAGGQDRPPDVGDNPGRDGAAGAAPGSAAAGTAVSQADNPSHALTIAALRLHAERMQQLAAERRVSEGFTRAHPHVPVAVIPAQPDDVHDLIGLRAVGDSFRAR
jgi:anion-transporting  ArsA/GET3 family ATPase